MTTPVDISPEAVERLCNDIDDPFTTGMDRLELVGVIRALAAERDELAQKLTAEAKRLDWLERHHTLHDSVETLYVVDGYQVQILRDNYLGIGKAFHGATLRAAIDAAMEKANG